jgi:ABC-type hemin transport system ATPase subunit
MLAAHHVTLRVGRKALLNDVSLAFNPGEVLALIGPNGAGKSTLLKAVAGELTPTTGVVELEQKPLAAWSLQERARRRAVLPQHSMLDFPFTVLEVVLLGRSPHGGGASVHDHYIARQALAAVEAAHLEQRLYPTLSGGERQRVQLARVLAQIWEPLPDGTARYLLLDEPTASLDLAHQHATLAWIPTDVFRANIYGGMGADFSSDTRHCSMLGVYLTPCPLSQTATEAAYRPARGWGHRSQRNRRRATTDCGHAFGNGRRGFAR